MKTETISKIRRWESYAITGVTLAMIVLPIYETYIIRGSGMALLLSLYLIALFVGGYVMGYRVCRSNPK